MDGTRAESGDPGRDDPGFDPSSFDEELLQHEAGGTYFHLFREVLLIYRTMLRRTAAETGLTGAQLLLMRVLAVGDGRSTTSELARELDVDPAAVTRLVAGLQERGLIEREDDPNDGRRRPVLLTSSGREYMVRLHDRLHSREGDLVAKLGGSSIATATEVLSAIRTLLESDARGRRV